MGYFETYDFRMNYHLSDNSELRTYTSQMTTFFDPDKLIFYRNGDVNDIGSIQIYPVGPYNQTLTIRVRGTAATICCGLDKYVDLLMEKEWITDLYAVFPNGTIYMVMNYSRDVTPIMYKNPPVFTQAAAKLAELHKLIDHPNVKYWGTTPVIWQQLEGLIGNKTVNSDSRKKLKTTITEIGLREYLRFEISLMRRLVVTRKLLVVFCHNDLNLNNISMEDSDRENEKERQAEIMKEISEDKEKERLRNGVEGSIDDADGISILFKGYEYSGPNYQAFDIAKHFVDIESTDCGTVTYPSEEFQTIWLRAYLEKYTNSKVDHMQVMVLRQQVNFFYPLVHLFWAVWGLVQSESSSRDYDYLEFSMKRLEEYKKLKTNLDFPTWLQQTNVFEKLLDD